MRLLLDESLPRRLARHLADAEADTVYDRGWSGLKNGDLLRAAEAEYDVFVTADQQTRREEDGGSDGRSEVMRGLVSEPGPRT